MLGWSWDRPRLLATAAGARRAWGAHWSHVLPPAVLGLGGWAPAVPEGTAACSAICSYGLGVDLPELTLALQSCNRERCRLEKLPKS